MDNPIKELCIAIEDGNITTATELLDQGAPMIVEHFRLAAQLKLYDVLDAFLSRGWDINTAVNHSVPSVLVYTYSPYFMVKLLIGRIQVYLRRHRAPSMVSRPQC